MYWMQTETVSAARTGHGHIPSAAVKDDTFVLNYTTFIHHVFGRQS